VVCAPVSPPPLVLLQSHTRHRLCMDMQSYMSATKDDTTSNLQSWRWVQSLLRTWDPHTASNVPHTNVTDLRKSPCGARPSCSLPWSAAFLLPGQMPFQLQCPRSSCPCDASGSSHHLYVFHDTLLSQSRPLPNTCHSYTSLSLARPPSSIPPAHHS
jgi:hypothetical protein